MCVLGEIYCRVCFLMGRIWVCLLQVECEVSDALWTQLDYTVVLRVVTAMGDNRLYDPLIHCWNTWDIGSDNEGDDISW